MPNRAVFLDRDGTMTLDVHYCSRPEDLRLFSETGKAVKVLNEFGYKVIVITNQSGIGRGYFTEETLLKIHEKMTHLLAKEGGNLDGIYYCPHRPDENCDCRKPKPGLLLKAAGELDIDLSASWIIGDSLSDLEAARMCGCNSIFINRTNNKTSGLHQNEPEKPLYTITDLLQAIPLIVQFENQNHLSIKGKNLLNEKEVVKRKGGLQNESTSTRDAYFKKVDRRVNENSRHRGA
jgi:D-glycero-D-manno-heptose 1,7-bisphosphate phosphatase